MKSVTMWAIISPMGRNHWMIPWTVRPRKNEAIAAWLSVWTAEHASTWRYWRKQGYRAIRVTVTPQ